MTGIPEGNTIRRTACKRYTRTQNIVSIRLIASKTGLAVMLLLYEPAE